MLKVVVLVSGGGTNLQAILDKIADGTVTNTKIAAVISNNENAFALERARKAGIVAECISPKQFPYPTKEVSEENESNKTEHIVTKTQDAEPKNALRYDRKAFQKALFSGIKKYEPDLVVLAGFLVILPPELIAEYQYRLINIHPSLIPSFCGTGYYGLKVHEAVLARGNKVTGATVHFVDEGTDTGPILLQKAVAVKRGDTPQSLQLRVMQEAEWEILPRAIDAIANGRVIIEDGNAWIVE